MATIIRVDGTIENSVLKVNEKTKKFDIYELQCEIKADTRLVFAEMGRGRVMVYGYHNETEDAPMNDVATTICRQVGDVSSIVRGDALVCEESEVSYY